MFKNFNINLRKVKLTQISTHLHTKQKSDLIKIHNSPYKNSSSNLKKSIFFKGIPKIIYSSRTHSQLSQAISELKRTTYKHMKVINIYCHFFFLSNIIYSWINFITTIFFISFTGFIYFIRHIYIKQYFIKKYIFKMNMNILITFKLLSIDVCFGLERSAVYSSRSIKRDQ